MQQSISKERLVEMFDLLSPFQQRTVFTFIDSLLMVRTDQKKRDKSSLLQLSAWDDDDIQEIEDAQKRINEWQIPDF